MWFARRRSIDDHYTWNFSPQLTKMHACCKSWANRALSLKGKVTVLNTLVLSLLQYIVANSLTPPRVLAEVKKLTCSFLWSGKNNKVAYSTIIQSINDGGLRVMDLESRCKTNRISWVRRILSSPLGSAAETLKALLGEQDLSFILGAKREFPHEIAHKAPFYAEVLDTWAKFHNLPPTDGGEVARELIWFNSRITSANNMLTRSPNWHKWIEAGIPTIGHVCHSEEGRLLGQEEIADKFKLNANFLQSFSLRSSIPFTWKKLLMDDCTKDPQLKYDFRIEDQKFDLHNSHQRSWYKAIVRTKAQEIKRKGSWVKELTQEGEPEIVIDWEETFALPYQITRETKLQTFFFKIAHRLCPCNKYL